MARRAALLGMLSLVLASGAAAQSTECDRLYAAIQSAGSSGGDRWARAAAQQQAEIDRTQSYADRLGCGRGFLGLGEPAICGGLTDRLQRMHDNLAALQARSGGGDRSALLARYNDLCVGIGGNNPGDLAGQDQRGIDDGAAHDPRQDFFDPDGLRPLSPDGDTPPEATGGRVLGQAICVRSCDGGWFPLGATATDGQLTGLDQLCQATCPNTETHLYTKPSEGALADATATDGTAYTALPAAFQFQKVFTPACTCKPPNQSWTEALAKAELLLGDAASKQDIVVTAALSDQMAKPGAVPVPAKDKGKPSRKGKGPAPAPQGGPGDLASSTARDGAKGLQAPTASEATAGIGGPTAAERLVRQGEGQRVTVPGPDGAKRTLRLIVP